MPANTVLWRCPNCKLALNVNPNSVPFNCKCGILVEEVKVHPTLIRKGFNFFLDGVKHTLDSWRTVNDEVRDWRLTQCESCTLFDNIRHTCTHPRCGCYMKQRKGFIDALSWASKMCPIGRWDNPPPPVPYTLNDITVVVSSFLRFECLKRLLVSMRHYYPEIRFVVADQSGPHAKGEDYEFCKNFPNVEWVTMKFDSGISACRNKAVEASKTRLIMVLDDDHVITEESKIEHLVQILNTGDVDLICGVLRMCGPVGDWGKAACGWFADLEHKNDGVLHAEPPKSKPVFLPNGIQYRRVDRFINCFLTKRSTLIKLPWFVGHKIAGEHIDHVVQLMKAGVRSAYTVDCIFGELHENSELYRQYRSRNTSKIAWRRWGIKNETGFQRIAREYGIPDRMTTMPDTDTSCIVILTPGHTGSTITAGLFNILGWNLPDNDPRYNEPISIREANEVWIDNKTPFDAKKILACLPKPWVIKDPRFCETLDQWVEAFRDYRPLLVLVTRDELNTIKSWERRELSTHNLIKRFEACEKHFQYWPWQKIRFSIENLADWAKSIDLERLNGQNENRTCSEGDPCKC